jgi:hypothetical protein
MPSDRTTRKARKCPILKKTKIWVLHGKVESSFTINYYSSKPKIEDGKVITHTFDKCKKIYEIIEDDVNRVVRRVDNHKVVLNVPIASSTTGDSFETGKSFWDHGEEVTICNSLVFNESEGDFTYVGHQVFSFKLLENIPNYMTEYHVHLTPTGIVKPYIVGKKYMYSLRDKIAVPLKSLNIDRTRYMNEQLKDIDARFRTVDHIPFSVNMIDPGMESGVGKPLIAEANLSLKPSNQRWFPQGIRLYPSIFI